MHHGALTGSVPAPRSARAGAAAAALVLAASGAAADHRITEGMRIAPAAAPQYTLALEPGGRRIRLTGTLQIGIAAAFERMLAHHPDVSGVVLDSDGGNVYQARGLAATTLERGLDTWVYRRCHSACTLVYLAGRTRRLGPDAQIGFHCWRVLPGPGNPLVDVDREQAKDRRYVEARVPDAAFVRRVFECDRPGLWVPDAFALLAAGVVHEIVPE